MNNSKVRDLFLGQTLYNFHVFQTLTLFIHGCMMNYLFAYKLTHQWGFFNIFFFRRRNFPINWNIAWHKYTTCIAKVIFLIASSRKTQTEKLLLIFFIGIGVHRRSLILISNKFFFLIVPLASSVGSTLSSLKTKEKITHE